MSVENQNTEAAGSGVADSLRGSSASDVSVGKIAYAPPTLIRAMRTIVPIVAGLLAIALFTWAYVQSYNRANAQIFNDYIAQQYVIPEPAAPELPLEERVEASFSPPADITPEALADLSNVEYVLSTQLASHPYVELARKENIVYFTIGRKEYTITLSTSESYQYIDAFIVKNNKAD